MYRRIHSILGLTFGLLLLVLAVSGAILSLDPTMERMQAGSGGTTVAQLAAQVSAIHPQVERLDRLDNGVFLASVETLAGFEQIRIDPASGADLAVWQSSPTMRWIRNLHRSLQLGDVGRAVAGAGAATLAVLGLTGLVLLALALGGWRRLARRPRSTGANRWHAVIGRLVALTLTLSALTGLWMSLATFGLISDGQSDDPILPETVVQAVPAPVGTLAGLKDVPVDELRRLTWPADATDVFGLRTTSGEGYVDPVKGELLGWQDISVTARLQNWIYAIHTGQGLWWLGLVLGAGALAVPVLTVTGFRIWWKRRAARPCLKGTVSARRAEIVILVGSEGGTTWGFAATLARTLIASGRRVSLGEMNAIGPMPAAKAVIMMSSTYGEGVAPVSAAQFLGRIAGVKPVPAAVLGFGDSSFPQFCGFAKTVSTSLDRTGWPELLPLTLIDRQSSRNFAIWGKALGDVLGQELDLDHKLQLPALSTLRLSAREDFEKGSERPAAILRFTGTALPRFEAGDLLGVMPKDSASPRFYSLASGHKEGFAEIAVRRVPNGLCSGLLHDLQCGDDIRAFIRPNPTFRVAQGKAPVIMIAAGCGIGPMVGFLRGMRSEPESSLYFGIRDPQSDFLYQSETDAMLADGRLTRRVIAASRVMPRRYVQDALREDGADIARQIRAGGQVLICGSTAMAHGVAEAFAEILRPLDLTVEGLKSDGRYFEDVY